MQSESDDVDRERGRRLVQFPFHKDLAERVILTKSIQSLHEQGIVRFVQFLDLFGKMLTKVILDFYEIFNL